MAKLVLNDITTGFASTDLLNANNAAIEVAFENTLSRDGTTPNTMSADLDMNGHRILNQLATSGDGFVWESAWVTGTSYTVNNLVREAGTSYICLIAHTSGTFATDLSAGKWEIFAAKGDAGAGTGDVLAANNLSEYTATAATARSNISAAKSGANSDITSLSGLTTALSIAQGGTSGTTATAAFDALAPTTTQGDTIYHNGTDNIRLAKGTALQQYRMNSGATAPEWFTPIFSSPFESALQTPIASTVLTFAHGLSGIPPLIRAVLVAGSVPEAGYATSDEVEFISDNGSGAEWSTIHADATNVYVVVGPALLVANKTTKTYAIATLNNATKWQVKVYAWK